MKLNFDNIEMDDIESPGKPDEVEGDKVEPTEPKDVPEVKDDTIKNIAEDVSDELAEEQPVKPITNLEAKGVINEEDINEDDELEDEDESEGIMDKLKGLFGSKETDDIATMTFADKHRKAKKKRIRNIILGVLTAVIAFGGLGTLAATSGIFESKQEPAKKLEQPKEDQSTPAQQDLDKEKQEEEQKAKDEADKKAKEDEEKLKADEKAKREAEDKAEANKKTDEQIKQEVDKKVQEGLERATKSVVEEYNKKLQDANKKVDSVNSELNSIKSERDQLRAQLESVRRQNADRKITDRIDLPQE